MHSKKGEKHGCSKTDKGKIVIDPCWCCIDNKRLWGGDAVSASTRQSSQPSCAPRRATKDSKGEILYSEENHLWESKTCRFQKCKLQSFLTEFLQKTGNENLIEDFDMQPFDVNVLDRRRTLTEKLVSLLRCSLADNYMPELTAKIRHFYDLHFLLNDAETQDYLKSYAFKSDFSNLFVQDQQRFDKPEGWQNKDIMDSTIISDLHSVWSALSNVYAKELPDLAYKDIPTIDSIENSMEQLISYLTK